MGTPMTMRFARWKREANCLIFSHVAVSSGVIDSPETPLYLASIASASNSGSCSCQISNVCSIFREECIDDGGGRGFFLSWRGHYVQDIHIRCPSHVGCRGLKPASDKMSRYVSMRSTSDGLSGRRGPAEPRLLFVKASYCHSTSPSSCALAGSLQDELRDFVGLGYQRQVTRLHFDGFGTHPLGHEAFEIGIDRAIVR